VTTLFYTTTVSKFKLSISYQTKIQLTNCPAL